MKLSEAIREGAKLRPQGWGGDFDYDLTTPETLTYGSTAWGAAMEILMGRAPQNSAEFDNGYQDEAYGRIQRCYGDAIWFYTVTAPCGFTAGLAEIISHLEGDYDAPANTDEHRHDFKREQIADWLEGQGL